jgi:signal transduction histidine kinase
MDDKTASRAFEPLFTSSASGTGLGLAIVRKIVEEHGGHVSLDSTPNRWTKVTLVIPAGTQEITLKGTTHEGANITG